MLTPLHYVPTTTSKHLQKLHNIPAVLSVVIISFFSLFLMGCDGKTVSTPLQVNSYQTTYQGKISLKSLVSTGEELVFLEDGEATTYLDSLIIQEKYNQGKGALVFSQEAMAVALDQWLEIEHIQETKLVLYCHDTPQSAVLLSYLVRSGIPDVTMPLYQTHLFLEKDPNTLMIWSHSTEEKKEQERMKSALAKVLCS